MTDELERTQVYLTRSERSLLERVHRETGVTQSELIRRAIDGTYLRRARMTREERRRAAREAAGAWRGRRQTGASYTERLRPGRLARLRDR
jgi:hypothetical protein